MEACDEWCPPGSVFSVCRLFGSDLDKGIAAPSARSLVIQKEERPMPQRVVPPFRGTWTGREGQNKTC